MAEEAEIPNAVTLKTFEDTDAELDLVRGQNADEMFEQLGI